MPQDPKVVLVSPPWRTPDTPCLALATLGPSLARAGIACDELHGSLRFPRTALGEENLEFFAPFLFAPWLFPGASPESAAEALLREYLRARCKAGIASPLETTSFSSLGECEEDLRRRALLDIEHAGECIERCVQELLRQEHDIVGLSATFDTQVPAAIAIANRLKARRPEVRIVMGGAACFEQQAEGLMASFPVLDAVCHTEGEEVIVPLVRALHSGQDLEGVPGIVYRDAAGVVRRTPSPPLLEDMDRLPLPDYRRYLAQLASSPWAGRRPRLFFETSRGCWWGQKHLCTFCGINGEGLAYRSKSPERAFEEIRALHAAYPEARLLQATDNILDLRHVKVLMPRLAELQRRLLRPLRLFYEVKTNLRREQVHLLARSGVVAVQPGIESLSDGVLALMRKGCTGLGQVQFLKWATEAGLEVMYNIIVGNPGERPEWYRAMTRLVPFIEHLPPPRCVTPMMLERFSPYHRDPGAHGIVNVRPRAAYHDIYRDPRADLARIAYVFDFDHPERRDPVLLAAQRELIAAVRRWASSWAPGRLGYRVVGRRAVVLDRRGGGMRTDVLSGLGFALLEYLHRVRPLSAILRRFAHVDPALLLGVLSSWHARRWVATDDNGRYLAVVPRHDPVGDQPAVAAEALQAHV